MDLDLDILEKDCILKPFVFTLQNEKIYIDQLVNISLFKLLCEINKKFIENFFIQQLNEYTIHVFIIANHLFKDIGFPQYFFKLIIELDEIKQQFRITSRRDLSFQLPFQYNPKSSQLELNMNVDYIKINEHQYDFNANIEYSTLKNIDSVTQNMIIKIINQLFNNLKKGINQYICY